MKRFRTVHAMAVAMVLAIMVLSGLLSMLLLSVMRRLHLFQSLLNAVQFLPLVVLVVSVILGTIIAVILTQYMVRPFERLISALRAVGKGDFSVRVPEDEFDEDGELGQLFRSFNRMVEELDGIEMFRSDFINTFSHEFKTPIISVRGYARRLQREDLSDEERRECAAVIAAESERLSNLSSNVLLLSRFEHQSMIGDRAEYDLDEQLRSCILLLEKQWSEKQLELDIELEPLRYTSNEEMLTHVWLNILGNAVKFTPEGGTIAVRLFRRSDAAVVQIRDTGIGMPKEVLNHIFDKFYQGDRAHASQGNGLGLPLVKRIVQLSGGSILVESQLGVGTVFTVTLPF